MVAGPSEFLSTFPLRTTPLEMRRECREFFPDEAEKGTLTSSYKADTGILLMLAGPSAFLSNEDGYIREIFEVQQWCEDPLEVEEGRCDLPPDASVESDLISPEGRTSWIFSSWGRFLSTYDRDHSDPLVWPH